MIRRVSGWARGLYRDHVWARRLWWGFLTWLILTAIVLALLSFADSYSEPAKVCAPDLLKAKLPMWIGCAMAHHEDLAAGLIGGAGALFAAWLAFTAIMEQIGEERKAREEQQRQQDESRLRQQAEAKQAAIMCITPAIHAAAAALSMINNALLISGGETGHPDLLVSTEVTHIQSALDSFMVRESLRDLGLDDRLIYLAIIGTLSTVVNINTHPSPAMSRVGRLDTLQHALMNLHTYLWGFDQQLAAVFARDSATTAPPSVQVQR